MWGNAFIVTVEQPHFSAPPRLTTNSEVRPVNVRERVEDGTRSARRWYDESRQEAYGCAGRIC